MNALETLSKKLNTATEQAKKLTTEIAAVQDTTIVKSLHTNALDLLLSIAEIDRDIRFLISKKNLKISASVSDTISQKQKLSSPVAKSSNGTLSESEKTDEEIKKVKRKLPRWSKNPDQINSQILITFLTLQENNQAARISESELKEAYGNDYEFFRNFNQMKTIAPKNHAKVFNVKHGLIEIWEPVKSFVETFRDEVTSLNGPNNS